MSKTIGYAGSGCLSTDHFKESIFYGVTWERIDKVGSIEGFIAIWGFVNEVMIRNNDYKSESSLFSDVFSHIPVPVSPSCSNNYPRDE